MKQYVIPAVLAKTQKELTVALRKLKGITLHVHLDVVDHKFAPSSSLQFPLKLPKTFNYSAHLMMEDPEPWIRKQGTKIWLNLPHWEAMKQPARYIKATQRKKKPVGFALLPETSVKSILPYVASIDYLLLLTVHPGFYGSRFLKTPLKKITSLKRANPFLKIIVDGHMNEKTIKKALDAGADHFVSGSFIMHAKNPRNAMQVLRKALKTAPKER